MIDHTYIDLINGEIDGVNSPADSEKLYRFLDANEKAKTYHEVLERIVRRMEAQPQVEPPAELLDRIMATIPGARPPAFEHTASRETAGFFSWLREAWTRPQIRLAATFSFGFIVAAIVFTTIGYRGNSGDPLDQYQLSGTMKTIDSSDGFEQIGALAVDLEQVHGEVRLLESESTLLADVDLDSAGEIEWVLQYDDDDVAFEGFRRFARGSSEVAAAGTEMRVTHRGDNRFLLFFSQKDDSPAPIKIQIFAADRLIYEDAIVGRHEN